VSEALFAASMSNDLNVRSSELICWLTGCSRDCGRIAKPFTQRDLLLKVITFGGHTGC